MARTKLKECEGSERRQRGKAQVVARHTVCECVGPSKTLS